MPREHAGLPSAHSEGVCLTEEERIRVLFWADAALAEGIFTSFDRRLVYKLDGEIDNTDKVWDRKGNL